jgi:hypothetical protein
MWGSRAARDWCPWASYLPLETSEVGIARWAIVAVLMVDNFAGYRARAVDKHVRDSIGRTDQGSADLTDF